MAETENEEEVAPKKSSKLPLLLGLVLALAGGGGGFYAVYSGLLFGAHETDANAEDHAPDVGPLPDISFVPLDAIVVSLGSQSSARHLQFRAQLEVPKKYLHDVESLSPRVIDVLNGYLRALEPGDIETSEALMRIRAQMLRRVQMVVGDGRVNDLLVMEFVLN